MRLIHLKVDATESFSSHIVPRVVRKLRSAHDRSTQLSCQTNSHTAYYLAAEIKFPISFSASGSFWKLIHPIAVGCVCYHLFLTKASCEQTEDTFRGKNIYHRRAANEITSQEKLSCLRLPNTQSSSSFFPLFSTKGWSYRIRLGEC